MEQTTEGLYHEWCAARGAVRGADAALTAARKAGATKATLRALEALQVLLAGAEHEAMSAYMRALDGESEAA